MHNDFERGNTDVFKVSAVDLGDLKGIHLSKTGKYQLTGGDAWMVSSVEIDGPYSEVARFNVGGQKITESGVKVPIAPRDQVPHCSADKVPDTAGDKEPITTIDSGIAITTEEEEPITRGKSAPVTGAAKAPTTSDEKLATGAVTKGPISKYRGVAQ